MASPQLVIAKASFSAVLLRPDPTSCSRDEIEHFHTLLNTAITRCSPANVQKCKQWILSNLATSPARAAALGKYLVALVDSLSTSTSTASDASIATKKPSTKRRRLHVLYIINDVLHHTRKRQNEDSFVCGIEPSLPTLFKSAASFTHAPKHIKKLNELVNIWNTQNYVRDPEISNQLLDAIVRGQEAAPESSRDAPGTETGRDSTKKSSKEVPFVMPATHGDPSTAWYDLPAGNWLPVLEPNSTRPMNPALIKPLQLASGPADKGLVDAVSRLLARVDRIYGKDVRLADDDTPGEYPAVDIDQMGERVELDEITGEVLDGETYYGWSRAFCKKMKARRQGRKPQNPSSRSRSQSSRDSRSLSRGRDRSRSRSSRSRSTSPQNFKRRRVSQSRSCSSRSHSKGGRANRNRDYSSDRSRRRSRSYSPSRSRSRDPRQRSQDGPRRSASPGYSPPPANAAALPPPTPTGAAPGNYNTMTVPQFPPPLLPMQFTPMPGMPMPMPQLHRGYGGMQTQGSGPPQMPGFPGLWPPPPPQPQFAMHNQQQQAWAWGGAPMPPHHQQQPYRNQQPGIGYQNHGRGGANNNGSFRGRGGYNQNRGGRGW
ncbi:hypothetical protein MGG_04021 [Pyricularia oryzae 70-15]|uniref:CID domain-containing protein n=3 Tax=Pyricularia oryzae TaxID=318829 RepID=G4NGV0_PYRO7|nr:uncharacterized protein MGG_04021 [Pyricularia oryzae 70-15]EHA47460.1 hypothetical protein MGG_04021 [Pyricularia oryzae 70-15]ELQ39156.1 hypothetical protein OOU_Y34scaffold00514g73 [Pyricularia oryzae Y34]KAI7920014.1 hypothetical protein M9X92_006069 [Pyricularia oryzae]KAI7932497.1 hypothetical protein M0657_000246 [Pyricularia oryzae]